MAESIRVLIAKPGLDEHTWGPMFVAQYLRDQGMEVIYLDMATADQIAEAAIQEDVNVLGLSISCGSHRTLLPRVLRHLEEKGAPDMLVIAGGNIPKIDVPELKDAGIAEVFGAGTPPEHISQFIKDRVGARTSRRQNRKPSKKS